MSYRDNQKAYPQKLLTEPEFVMKDLKIGEQFTRKKLGEILDEQNLATTREGVFSCKNSNMYLLFVNLNKDSAKENHKFNDYFEGNYFHWDSQPRQHFNTPTIQDLAKGARKAHLFARIYPKIKGVSQPYIYCGPLTFESHIRETKNPVHIIFSVDTFLDSGDENHPIFSLYHWKPQHVGHEQTYSTGQITNHTQSNRKHTKPNSTERKGLITSRVGQGYYRHHLRERWKDTCPLTGCQISRILIASHIVPWKDSTDEERLDIDNGILLSPNADALFDQKLISFNDDGGLVLAKTVSEELLNQLGISSQSRIQIFEGMKPYLKRHRSQLQSNT